MMDKYAAEQSFVSSPQPDLSVLLYHCKKLLLSFS